MATAELATIAPFAVAFAFLLLWVVSLGLTQIRIADASREAARMIARGEAVPAAKAVALEQAPDGAKVTIETDSDSGTVTVNVTARSRMPLLYFSGIGAQELDSASVAATEAP